MKTEAKRISTHDARLARYAKALGHPVRVSILKYLSSINACCAGTIFDQVPMAQSTVSQHLKELKKAGLIRGTIDPPRVHYCIDRENWEEAKKLFLEFF
ncbi:MAG: ArsR family transcriptional regulator [Balneolaceae bacterium]|nr:MAG: ArsR family transcriptional regulator [Balneolaceae bacterium]